MRKADERRLDILRDISRANSLQLIVDLAYELFGNPIFIADLAHTMLAYTKCVEVPHEMWQTNVVGACLERNTLKQNREIGSVRDVSAGNAMPVMVNDDHIPFPRIIKALHDGDRTIGVMVLTAYFQELEDDDISLMEILSFFVITRMQKEQVHISGSSRTVENYFIKLLNGAEYSCEHIRKHLDVLGWIPAPHQYLLAFWPQNDEEGHGGVMRTIKAFSERLNCCCFLYDSSIVCIYKSKQEVFDWQEQAPELYKILRESRLIAGVSRRFTEPENLPEHYNQCLQALRIGKKLERQFAFFIYDNLSIYNLFEQIPIGNIGRFCHQKICKLDDYDRANNTELCATLQVYLENMRSLSRTSEILYVHRNTVRYRIDKCMRLLESKLDDNNEAFAVMLSLRIIEYKKKFVQGQR